MKRKELLDEAGKCVLTDRESQYGSPENNFNAIAALWNVYLDSDDSKPLLTGHDVAVMMTLMKIARIKTGQFKDDNYVDAIGYLACAGELNSKPIKSFKDVKNIDESSMYPPEPIEEYQHRCVNCNKIKPDDGSNYCHKCHEEATYPEIEEEEIEDGLNKYGHLYDNAVEEAEPIESCTVQGCDGVIITNRDNKICHTCGYKRTKYMCTKCHKYFYTHVSNITLIDSHLLCSDCDNLSSEED